MPTDLWSFALQLYAIPGIEQRCLNYQENGGNVCLLLCATWLETGHAAFDDRRLAQLQHCAEQWAREVVTPLRALRMSWKDNAATDVALATLRTQVKALELDAERILLERLAQLSGSWPTHSAPSDWLDHLIDLAPPDRQGLREAVVMLPG